MLWPKKNSYKEFDNKKKIPAARKFPFPTPPPPITFLMVRPVVVVENSSGVKASCRKWLVKRFHKLTDDVFAKSSVLIRNTERGQKKKL